MKKNYGFFKPHVRNQCSAFIVNHLLIFALCKNTGPHMKTVIYPILLTLGIFTPSLHAQALNFAGLDVQLGLGYQATTGTASIADSANGAGTVSNASMGSVATTLGISYTSAITKQYSLGAILETNPLKLKAGSTLATPPATYTVNNYDETFKNVYSLSLVPGYAIDKAKLIYTKLGYTNASAIYSSNDGSANSSTKLNGYNLGLGLRVDTGNFYPFAEINSIKFNNAANLLTNNTGVMKQGGSAYNLIAGVGYHF